MSKIQNIASIVITSFFKVFIAKRKLQLLKEEKRINNQKTPKLKKAFIYIYSTNIDDLVWDDEYNEWQWCGGKDKSYNYIGSTDNMERRHKEHKKMDLSTNFDEMKRYWGFENFEKNILFEFENITKDDLFKKERECILKYNGNLNMIHQSQLIQDVMKFHIEFMKFYDKIFEPEEEHSTLNKHQLIVWDTIKHSLSIYPSSCYFNDAKFFVLSYLFSPLCDEIEPPTINIPKDDILVRTYKKGDWNKFFTIMNKYVIHGKLMDFKQIFPNFSID